MELAVPILESKGSLQHFLKEHPALVTQEHKLTWISKTNESSKY